MKGVITLTTSEKIGNKLRELRESRNYTLEEVADKVGKARQTIHKYEIGTISISVGNLREILNIYGVSVGRFLDDID